MHRWALIPRRSSGSKGFNNNFEALPVEAASLAGSSRVSVRDSKTFRKLRKILEGGTASPVLVSLSKITETLISGDSAIISRAPARANNNPQHLKGVVLNRRFSEIPGRERVLLNDSFGKLEI